MSKRETFVYTAEDCKFELEGYKMKCELISDKREIVVCPVNKAVYRPCGEVSVSEYREVWNILKQDRTTEVIEITKIKELNNGQEKETLIWKDFIEKVKGTNTKDLASEYGYLLSA